MPKPLLRRGLAALILLCAGAFGSAPAAGNPPVTPERPAEYMVYQYADTVLVVRADLPEASFGLRVLDPERAQLRAARLAGRRLGPVYLYIDAHELPRQLMIEVTPERPVDRAAIGLELIQFAAGDRKDAALARAYRQYSIGVEAAASDDAATWAAKVYSLRDAAARFAALGREEMRLWAEYFAAQLVLFELDDAVLAAELVREVRTGARRAGFRDVELAARLLEGDAEAARLEADATPAPGDFERAGAALSDAAGLAGELGLPAEQGRALYRHGQVLEWQGDTAGALAQYRQALDALAAPEQAAYPDTELLNALRAAAAAAYESLGSTAGALAMLDDIGGSASPTDDDAARQEEAGRLFERGRLLNLAYRHEDAARALQRALELQRGMGSSAWSVTALELGWSGYALGRNEESLALLQEALPRVDPAAHGKAVARAWGALAGMVRAQGLWEQAARARANQRDRVQAEGGAGLAEVLYEAALDLAAREGRDTAEVRQQLLESRRAAAAQGDALAAARAALRLCLAEAGGSGTAECGEAELQALRGGGVPRLAVEADDVHARLLGLAGRPAAARRELEGLLDEIGWYRRALPGVLGAWFAAHAGDVAAQYLALAAQDDVPAEETLLALERVRVLEPTGADAVSRLDPGREETLRGLLAQREAAVGAKGGRLAAEIGRALAGARDGCEACRANAALPSVDELRERLDSLDRSEAVLAYYLGRDRAWAVLAGRGERRRVDLAQPGRIRDALQVLQADLPRLGPSGLQETLDELGRALLAPLADALPARLYLLPTGALRAVPLDRLRLGGDYLAARSGVVNLAGLHALRRLRPELQPNYRDAVFLAGNPQSQRDPFRFDLSASPEIDAVTGLFVGPGLHVVQGVALGRDEFADPRYAGAALLHLAIPGVADLERPDRSRLQLGGPDAAGGVHGLSPAGPFQAAAGQATQVRADLAVLSGTAVAGLGPPYAGRVPLVADLLDAGSGAVVYSLWPAGEAAATAFARSFYGRLARDPDIVSAFLAGRAEGGVPGPRPDLENGSGFQLFIR